MRARLRFDGPEIVLSVASLDRLIQEVDAWEAQQSQ